jgi:hypothetical protein
VRCSREIAGEVAVDATEEAAGDEVMDDLFWLGLICFF